MSLLMDALKQQNQDAAPMPAPTQSSQHFWQWFALGLLVVLGIFVGFLLAQWLQKETPKATHADAVNPNSVQTVVPQAVAVTPSEPLVATPGLILSDLLSVPVEAETDVNAEEQLVISGQRQQPSNDWQAAAEQFEEYVEPPAMAEADLDEPVQELPASTPELSADEVSQSLRDKFQFALESSEGTPFKGKVTESAAPARDIHTLDDLLQRQIPPLRFQAHVYATDPKQRWVKVNGKDLQEGQWVTADIQLKEITPNYVLLQTGRQLFSMEALSEWSYRLKN